MTWREHTPEVKTSWSSVAIERAKPEGLAYLETGTKTTTKAKTNKDNSRSKDKYGDSGCARMTSEKQLQILPLPAPASKLAGDPFAEG
jgi:hypothetical protein